MKTFNLFFSALFLFTIGDMLSQDRAPSCGMTYDNIGRGDIIMNSFKIPTPSPTYTYYSVLNWNSESIGNGYCGIQEHPDGRNFIFSLWDHEDLFDSIQPFYLSPGTTVEHFGNEGTGLKSLNYDLGWQTDQWYTAVSRTWSIDFYSYFGFWIFDHNAQEWTHIISMEYPYFDVDFDPGHSAFIEDWFGSGQNPRTLHLKDFRKRIKNNNSSEWNVPNGLLFNRVAPDSGAINYIDNYDGGINNDYLFMTTGGNTTPNTNTSGSYLTTNQTTVNPEFDTAVITNFIQEKQNNGYQINWDVDSSKSPQFSYHLKVYDNSDYSGSPLIKLDSILPHKRSVFLSFENNIDSTTQYYITLQVKDLFDNSSTVLKDSLISENTISYCTPLGNTSGEYIKNVKISNINHNSGASIGYSDFTSEIINVNKNETVDFEITPNWVNSTYPEYYYIWIDYNNDGSFSTTDELVWQSPNAINDGLIQGQFNIPENSISGNTRLRVTMSYYETSTACSNLQYGEIEDYTIHISNIEIDDQSPSKPLNFQTTDITTSSVNLSWDSSTDNVGVVGYQIFINGVFLASTDSTQISITGLNINTFYQASVLAFDAEGNQSEESSLNFTTLNNTTIYCEISGNTTDEYLKNIELSDLSHSSGPSEGYSDFTNQSASVNKGNNYTINISPQWSGNVYEENYAVWIDYNQDGDFDDNGEKVWQTTQATNDTLISGQFLIPNDALIGNTRMRVVMSFNQINSYCGNIQYGEAEDYSIIIDEANADTQPPSTPLNLTASNTTYHSTVLNWDESTDNVGVTGYNIYINGDLATSTTATTFPVHVLLPNITYELGVQAFDEEGNTSEIATVTVITPSEEPAYCQQSGNSSSEYIHSIEINEISNISGQSSEGYSDFTDQIGYLNLATNTTIKITPQWPGSSYAERYYVWIDYNQDFDFEDEGELVWTSNGAISNTPITGTFTIPNTAELGETRMRVTMSFETITTPCEDYLYGETEDYTVDIGENFSNGGCESGITTFPYFQSFESDDLSIIDWENNINNDLDWNLGTGTTPTNGTGPNSAFNGSNYIYIESSVSNVGFPNKYATITLPCLNASEFTSSGYSVKFRYHMRGSSMGQLWFQTSTDNGETWQTIWTKNGHQGNSWKQANINLGTSYATENIKFRFKAKTKNGFRSDFAIDA
ncbi:MAG: GEVED domain-containing protein, partial [Flavobacteriales bacterium]